jgi:hypothetical protein
MMIKHYQDLVVLSLRISGVREVMKVSEAQPLPCVLHHLNPPTEL